MFLRSDEIRVYSPFGLGQFPQLRMESESKRKFHQARVTFPNLQVSQRKEEEDGASLL